MKTRTFESTDGNDFGAVGIPGRILKGIRIPLSRRKTHIHKNVRDLPTLEFKFILLYHHSVPCLLIQLHLRVGERLYLTTLKFILCNKIKVISHSHHNPIRMFLFRKPSVWWFHFTPPPFLGPQGFPFIQHLGKENLGKAHPHLNDFGLERTQITTHSINQNSLICLIQVKMRQENIIKLCARRKREKVLMKLSQSLPHSLTAYPSLPPSIIFTKTILQKSENAELSMLQSQTTRIQIKALLLVAMRSWKIM